MSRLHYDRRSANGSFFRPSQSQEIATPWLWPTPDGAPMAFIHEDFLLQTAAARRLYHEFAAGEPILDYHTHLPPQDLASNRRFENLAEIWLEGDHYKWRAMRANGVEESLCTGDAEPYDKFLAWARTVPHTLRNPLYHWTHMELKRYFDIDELLDEKSAPRIWEQAGEKLQSDELTSRGILKTFVVSAPPTTRPTIWRITGQSLAATYRRRSILHFDPMQLCASTSPMNLILGSKSWLRPPMSISERSTTCSPR